MVIINALELPAAEYGEEEAVETNLTLSQGQHPRYRQRLNRVDRVYTFTVRHLCSPDDLLALLEAQYNQILTITTEEFGTFQALLLQDPLQVVEMDRDTWDVTFRAVKI